LLFITLFGGKLVQKILKYIFKKELNIALISPLLKMISHDSLQWRAQEFCLGRGVTKSVEERGQRERGCAEVAP
jgi:hypothetical protein